jgi:hypothetical protein
MIEAVAPPSPHSSCAVVVQYETLRAAMLGEVLPPTARSGLVVFLYRGLWGSFPAVTPGTTRQEPIPATAFGPANPTAPGERRAVIQVLATLAMTINDRRSA